MNDDEYEGDWKAAYARWVAEDQRRAARKRAQIIARLKNIRFWLTLPYALTVFICLLPFIVTKGLFYFLYWFFERAYEVMNDFDYFLGRVFKVKKLNRWISKND